jgi:predicted ATPase
MRPYQAVGLGLQGRRLLEAGQAKAAVALLRSAIGQARLHGMIMPGFEGLLALALLGAGEIDSARAVVDTAIERIRSDGESHELPELLRILGEVQVRQGALADAVATFDTALAMADRQGALSWKLRVAMSRYRACAGSGEASFSRTIMADTYRQFSEGFETADLVAARLLLDHSQDAA